MKPPRAWLGTVRVFFLCSPHCIFIAQLCVKMSGIKTSPLQFEQLVGRLDVAFWYELEKRKLHEWKDAESPINLWGSYTTSTNAQLSSSITVTAAGFGALHLPRFTFSIHVCPFTVFICVPSLYHYASP